MSAEAPVHLPEGESEGQVQLVVDLRVRPGTQDELHRALPRLIEATRAEGPGCVRFEVGTDPTDDTHVVGYEVWRSQADLDRHRDQPHTRRFLDELRGLAVDADEPLTTSRWRPVERLSPARYSSAVGPPVAPASAPPGFEHRWYSVEGLCQHCVVGGSGDPLVLLHGFPNTWFAWREVMPALAERFRVVAVDLRGLGDSARPAGGSAGSTGDYGVATSAEDIHRLVGALDLGPVHLAGQDFGGSVGFALAAAHPERVRRLAVLEALPAGPWTAPGAGAWFAAFHSIAELPEILVEGRESPYLDWFYTQFSATTGVPTRQAVAEYLRTYGEPGAMSAAFGLYRGRAAEITHNSAPGRAPVPMPVLAVGGSRVFGATVAANLKHGARDVREVVLDEAGHFLTEERPAEIAHLLLDFFTPPST